MEYLKMTKPQIKIVNVATGEEIVRDASAEEIAQMEIDAANAAAKRVEAEAKAQAKAAAEGKLAALGLTTDDLRALGL
jgi:ribosomal protein L14E/L6E/L27E